MIQQYEAATRSVANSTILRSPKEVLEFLRGSIQTANGTFQLTALREQLSAYFDADAVIGTALKQVATRAEYVIALKEQGFIKLIGRNGDTLEYALA